MKSIKKIMMSIAICTAITAAPIASAATNEECSGISTLAKVIMNGRQNGIELKLVLGVGGGELTKIIAIAAYKEPLFYSEDRKKQSAIEFSNSWYISCLEAGGES